MQDCDIINFRFDVLCAIRIKTGDSAPITVKNNEHVLSLSGDDVLLEINKALSDKFGLEYRKSCVEQEIQKVAERDVVFIATEKGLHAADNAKLSEQEIKSRIHRHS